MVMGDMEISTDLLVIGAGPGGYGAAFRAADLGLDVILVDPLGKPGGVCLHKGCISSKSLLHLTELIFDARRASSMGVHFSPPQLDLSAIRDWKEKVINNLARDLVSLTKKRGILFLQGKARFTSSNAVRLEGTEMSGVKFKHAIIATGSNPMGLQGEHFIATKRIMDSTAALHLPAIPKTLLVVGGGYMGLELGSIYAALGSKVSLIERENRLLANIDTDLVAPVERRLTELFKEIKLNTQLSQIKEESKGVAVSLEKQGNSEQLRFDRILLAIGRLPNSKDLGLENTKIELDDRGFIQTNGQQQTADPKIYAVGDVTGEIMLAHTATREGRVAAEVICGQKSAFDARAVPAVVYTDPQISWCGLTEQLAVSENIPYSVQKFPWKYSGRAQCMGMTDGLTKLLTDPESGRLLGMGVVGRHAEELIAEGALAIEMGGLTEDLALTLHPHPSLSETEGEAAEIFQGSASHLILPPLPSPDQE